MAERRITAFFENYDDAAKAVQRLESAAIPHHEISLIASNADDAYSHHAKHAFDEEETHASELAGAGAAAGTVAGGGAGLLAGLGTVAVPGFGPIVAAGWLVSTLVGAGIGAATGGLVGALAGAGFSDEEASDYAENIRNGAVLVTVKVDEAEMDRVVDILDDTGEVEAGDERKDDLRSEAPAPPIGAAASTTTGLTTDLMPGPVDEDDHQLHANVEDERLRRIIGADREPS